jgi:rhamnosyltransferase subunit B
LPRSAAFVHHGGIGSTSQAVLAGIPQVLTPLAHDQFDNANRVKKFSIGDSIAMSQLNERTLKATLTRILQSSTAESKCSEFSAKLQTRDGLQRSAIAIEQLIAKQ